MSRCVLCVCLLVHVVCVPVYTSGGRPVPAGRGLCRRVPDWVSGRYRGLAVGRCAVPVGVVTHAVELSVPFRVPVWVWASTCVRVSVTRAVELSVPSRVPVWVWTCVRVSPHTVSAPLSVGASSVGAWPLSEGDPSVPPQDAHDPRRDRGLPTLGGWCRTGVDPEESRFGKERRDSKRPGRVVSGSHDLRDSGLRTSAPS